MQIDFLVENQIKHSVRLNLKRNELFPDLSQDKKQKFKIPIYVNTFQNDLTFFRKIKFTNLKYMTILTKKNLSLPILATHSMHMTMMKLIL
jgi:hypothetical protein